MADLPRGFLSEFGWRGAVWGGFQPVAGIATGIATGITERALLDLKARCPKKSPRTPGQRRLAPPFSEGDRRALAKLGGDLELVHEPSDAAGRARGSSRSSTRPA